MHDKYICYGSQQVLTAGFSRFMWPPLADISSAF